MAWFIYILRCSDKTLYTGITTDIARRIKAHNAKKGAFYTKNKLPVKLVYREALLGGRSEALKREKSIKRLRRSQKLLLIKSARDRYFCSHFKFCAIITLLMPIGLILCLPGQ